MFSLLNKLHNSFISLQIKEENIYLNTQRKKTHSIHPENRVTLDDTKFDSVYTVFWLHCVHYTYNELEFQMFNPKFNTAFSIAF